MSLGNKKRNKDIYSMVAKSFIFILERGYGDELDRVLICSGGLVSINIDLVSNSSCRGSGDAIFGHHDNRLIGIFDREGTVIV